MAGAASAANVLKADNADTLNLGTSWVGGAAPGMGDTAVWDSTVTALNTTNTLGTNLTWRGMQILNPAAPIYLNAGSTLTNGPGGIDMSSAAVNLSLSNSVTIGGLAYQPWNVASGLTLATLTVPVRPGRDAAPGNTGIVKFGTTGTIKLGSAASSILLDNQGNPWATYGLSDWAALDASGNVIPANYAEASAGVIAGTNIDMDASASVGTVAINSLRFNSPTPVVLTLNNSSTLTARGILVTPNCGGGMITNTAAFMRVNRSSVVPTSFSIIQNSTNDFTIATVISTISSGTSTIGILLTKYGQGNVNLAARNSYVNGTYIAEGSLTLKAGAAAGTSAVTVTNSQFIVEASNTTSVAGIVVNNGGTNTIKILAVGNQQTVLPVTFNSGATHLQFRYSGGVPMSVATAPLLVSNLTANGAVTVDVFNSVPAVGVYPLVKYTNSLGGTGFSAFSLGILPIRTSGYLSNDTVNSSIDLVVTNVNEPLTWSAGSGNWDIAMTPNWTDAVGASTTYEEVYGVGDSVVFSDNLSGASPLSIGLNTTVVPATVTFSGFKNYTLSGTGSISGSASVTKSGSGILTLATSNSFTGGLSINGGVVSFSALTNLGAGPISFGGGTLQFAGTPDDISVRSVTFNSGGATIDTFGSSLTFANPVGNAGVGGLTKAGAGTLKLNGTNRYSGNTVVSQGTLALGTSTYISNSAAIVVSSGAVLDTATSGVGLALSSAAGQILAGNGTINGPVTVTAGASISPATNGVVGALTLANDLTISGGALGMDVSTVGSDLIIVGGNLNITAGSLLVITNATPLTNGVYRLITYSGALVSGSGSAGNLTVAGFSQPNKVASLSDTLNPGEIDLVIADTANDSLSWAGVGNAWDTVGSLNWSNGPALWAYTNGDTVLFDDNGAGQPDVYLQSAVSPTSVTVNNTVNYTLHDGTGTGAGKITGATGLTKNGSGTLTLDTANTFSGSTVINAGTVQVGDGSSTGDIGTGNVTNNAALVFMQPDSRSVPGIMSGSGTLVQQGSGVLALTANNPYSGSVTISSGALQLGNGGTVGSIATPTITNNARLLLNRSGTQNFTNVVTGSGDFVKIGSSTTTISGSQSYLGNTYISNGVIKLSASETIPDANTVVGSTGWLILDGGAVAGTLDLNGLNETVNALSGLTGTVRGLITNSGSTGTNQLTILGTAATTFAGTIADNPSGAKTRLLIRGANIFQMTNNSYAGGTILGDTATLIYQNGATIGTGTLTMSNGTTLSLKSSGGGPNIVNDIIIPDGGTANFTADALGDLMSGNFYGGPNSTNAILSGISAGVANTQQYSNFLGTVLITTSGTLRFSSTSLQNNGGANTIFDIEGNGVLQTRNSGTVWVGALTGNGYINNPQANIGTGNFIIGTKGIDSTFSGTIQGTNSIVKSGSAKLTLSGTLSYVGNTTVSNGILVLAVDAANLDNSPNITIAANTAVLDVSARSDGALNLGNLQAQTLTGNGTIRGSLNEGGNSAINVGGASTIGTLSVTNLATLNGVVNMKLNITNSLATNDLLVANAFSASGTLNVTNVGPNLYNGQNFKLFSGPVAGFSAINLPSADSTGTNYYLWTTNVAVDGTITLVSGGLNPVATNPTNITLSVSGNTLNLSWPADHTGWTLQVQTNSLSTGLGTNWVDLPGSTTVNSTNIVMNPNNPTVFFRLKY